MNSLVVIEFELFLNLMNINEANRINFYLLIRHNVIKRVTEKNY